jgi:hypothetical protein
VAVGWFSGSWLGGFVGVAAEEEAVAKGADAT